MSPIINLRWINKKIQNSDAVEKVLQYQTLQEVIDYGNYNTAIGDYAKELVLSDWIDVEIKIEE